MGLYYECGNGFASVSFAKKDMGCDAYLCAPGPSLKDVDTDKLRGRGRKIFGINTSYPHVKPDVWLGMDKIDCYDRNILYEPFIKIFRGPFFNDMSFDGKLVKDYPDTYWARIKEPEKGKTMFDYREHKTNFAWHKSTLMVGLHMMIWMGAKNIHLVGCDLGGDKDYFHDKTLNDEQRNYNRRLYKEQAKHLEGLVQEGKRRGVKFYSCTPKSPINKFMDYVPIDEALKKSEEKTKFTEENTIKHVLEIYKPITVACLYKTGAYLTDEYVYRLKESVEKHLPKAKFVCLTDKDKIEGVDTVKLKYDWKGVFSKLELFEHFKGRTLYIDLSSKVKKDLTPFMKFTDFTMIADFVNPRVRSSAVMAWDGDYSFITEKFKDNPIKYMEEYAPLKGNFKGKEWKSCVDQKFIEDTVGLEKIHTWKWNLVSSYRISDKKWIDSSPIIIYHGKPKPHTVNWETYRPELKNKEEPQPTTIKTFEDKGERKINTKDEYIPKDSGIKELWSDDNPEVTVIIPYNKNRGWLIDAVNSVPKENVQLILSKGQGGWCENFNKALPLARGEYVRFLHEDDMLTENSIEDSLKAIKEQSVDFIHGDSIDIHENKNELVYWEANPTNPTIESLKRRNTIHGGAVLYKKSVFDKVGLFDETIPHAMEFEFNLRCIYQGLKLGYCNSYLYYYRRHDEQAVNVTRSSRKKWFEIHNSIIGRFDDNKESETILHITNWGIWGGVQSVVLSISKEYTEYQHKVFSINTKGEQRDTIQHFEKNNIPYKSYNGFIRYEDVKKINPKLIFLHSTRAKFLENDGAWLKEFKTIRVHHGWNLGELQADLNWFVSDFVFKKINYDVGKYFILPPVTYVEDYLNVERPDRKPVVGRIQSQTAIGGKPFPEKFYELIKQVDADTFIVSPEDPTTKNSFRNAKIQPGKMQEYLKEVDLFVVWQDKIETWCLVATEANLSGIPVIARDVDDGLSEQLKKSGGGILVKTEEEFLEKVNELINDDKLREKMGKKGKEWCIEHVNTKRLRATLNSFIQ